MVSRVLGSEGEEGVTGVKGGWDGVLESGRAALDLGGVMRVMVSRGMGAAEVASAREFCLL